MTNAQRELQRKWAWLVGAVVLVVVFADFFESNAAWFRWVAFAGIVIAAVSTGQSRSAARESGRERMLEIFDAAPWLKIWFSACALGSLAIALYTVRNSVDLFQYGGLRFLVLSFVFLLGPFVVVSERDRYRQLGDDNDAT